MFVALVSSKMPTASTEPVIPDIESISVILRLLPALSGWRRCGLTVVTDCDGWRNPSSMKIVISMI